MSETTTRQRSSSGAPAPAPVKAVPPPGMRRRPAVLIAGLTLVAVGVVSGWMVWSRDDTTIEVLAARDGIERGQVIASDDVAVARIPSDLGWAVVPASRLDDVVGKRAAVDVAAGTSISADAVTDIQVPADGYSIVGVELSSKQAPGMGLRVGDRVTVVVTPSAATEASDVPASTPAEVAGVSMSVETGNTVLDLLVPQAQSALLAARVATGDFAVVLESRDR
ncbi:hypothetical protein ET495_08025 [Xylanimonas allomyrinae]|uniref:AFP-like domain-containing protein n=1 Tax=Xylanimonas allomyrinae TaxID=2509459 RepID=A0A4P6EKR4_9MICO|nr:SAF domain-containing protein [Xylanimonas allomyrinae]QAY63194.1 hypothetical protein ET495_08025 [Xylanimonas allomyrinae]